jgi:glucosamine--fructose-6-phosphate aminotransferase (isomerizing)
MTENNPSAHETDPFLAEILEQPQAMRGAGDGLARQAESFEALSSLCRATERPLVLTGMGSSFDALQGLASVLARNGRTIAAVNTAELVNFGLPAVRPGSVVVAVSQSGRSAELVRLAREMPAHPHATLVSITNGVDNPLAAAAKLSLDMHAGVERGPATKTFAATMVMLSAIGRLLGSDVVGFSQCAARTAELAATAADRMADLFVAHAELAQRMSRWVNGRPNVVVLGRGVSLATAELGALILKEAAKVPAIGMDAAEFRHGPLELASPELAAIVVCLEPATLGLEGRLLTDVAELGAAALAIGRRDRESRAERIIIDPIDPLLDCAIAAAPIQLLAWSIAHERHPSPGSFLAGSKVTTQE